MLTVDATDMFCHIDQPTSPGKIAYNK